MKDKKEQLISQNEMGQFVIGIILVFVGRSDSCMDYSIYEINACKSILWMVRRIYNWLI